RIGKRPGYNLVLIAVRSDIESRCANKCDHFLWAHESVVEGHIRLDSNFLRQGLLVRSIAIALAAENVRMGRPCDYVNHVLVLRQDLRQGLNYIFDSLVWRKQTEREQDGLPLHAKAVLVEIRIEEWQIRDAMRNHVDLAAGHLKDFLQKLGRKLTHDNQTVLY